MNPPPEESLPLEDAAEIDRVACEFERSWKEGGGESIEDRVAELAGEPRSRLLRELLAIELHYRRRRGERPSAADYRARFAGDASLVEAVFREEEPATGGALHIRCPHCRNSVEVVHDAPLAEVTCPTCDSRFSVLGEPTIDYQPGKPQAFGHFELLEIVGTGAFGTVWKARDAELDRIVALKIPRNRQLSPAETEQFLREARAAAQLKHPGIVAVHEVGRSDGQVYIVSDFVDGVNLAEWNSGRCPPPQEAAVLLAKIARALHHAHERGVIHRDLKPSNIMLDSAGEPLIMDFGLAKREAGEITMTVEGKVVGTPAYMSPEQARGDAHAADRRSDIYSLGVILFELLTGEKPFRGSVRMLLEQVIHDEAPAPRKLDAGVPRDLETICLKCLEKSPERRYGTAQDVAGELLHFLAGEPILARPTTPLIRAWRWYRPRVPTIAAAYTVFTFTVLGIMQAGLILLGLFVISMPAAAPLWASALLLAFGVSTALVGVKSGFWTLRGLRRGLWISLALFGINSLACLWGLYWSLGITRDTTLEPLVRSSVLGYAVLCAAWIFTGLALQVHALCRRGEGLSAVPRSFVAPSGTG